MEVDRGCKRVQLDVLQINSVSVLIKSDILLSEAIPSQISKFQTNTSEHIAPTAFGSHDTETTDSSRDADASRDYFSASAKSAFGSPVASEMALL